MRSTSLVLATLSLSLAACGGDAAGDNEPSENLSVEEVAERTRDNGIKPEPGQYRVSMEVLEVKIPGAPDGAADMMRGMMGGQTHQYCLTQEDVENGFEDMVKQSQEGDCTFDKWDIDGGDFDGKMTCNVPGQGSMTMTMAGKGTPTRSEVDMTMQGNMGGMGESTIRMKATHERIGDCA